MLNGVDAGEVAALERDLDRRIARCSEDAAAAKRRIAAETRRRKRKAEELQKHERLTFNLHADLVNALQTLDELRATVNSFDVKLLKYQKHTENKSAALDVLQQLTALRVHRVRDTNDQSREHAEAWMAAQQSSLAKGYAVVSSCVASSHRWLRVWPLLHLWLSSEHAAAQSIHASAEAQGLVGELLALSHYASVIKLKHPQPEEKSPEVAVEAPVKGISIKPFAVKVARPSMIQEAVSKLRKQSIRADVSSTPSEAALAVKDLIRRVSAQVQDDNAATKAEIVELTAEISRLEEVKKTNAALMGELCGAVSADTERCIKEVQAEAERTLYDLSFNKDGTAATAHGPMEPPMKPEGEAVEGAATRKAATPSFDKPRPRRKKGRKEEEKDTLRREYEKHGYSPDKQFGRAERRSGGSSKRDYILDWLHKFAWKRQLDYSFVRRKLDVESQLDGASEDAMLLVPSLQPRHHSVQLQASGRHSSSHGASKRVAARHGKNSAAEAMLRAKLAVIEAEKIAATLHCSTFRYCVELCKRVDMHAPEESVDVLDDSGPDRMVPAMGIEADMASAPPRRRDGRKMSSIDILSMEGRLMPSVVEDHDEDQDEDQDEDEEGGDLVVSRNGGVNDGKENCDNLNMAAPVELLFTEDSISANLQQDADVDPEHVAGSYSTRFASDKAMHSATAPLGSQLNTAISDVFQWIKYKQVAGLLAMASNGVHPAAPSYLLRHVNAVLDTANASKAMERELRAIRRRRNTRRMEKDERRKSNAEHVLRTAGLFLQPDRDGRHKVSSHHWNEVSANLSKNAKYNATGIIDKPEDSDASVIALREQQRMARKTRVNELSKQLRERQLSPQRGLSPEAVSQVMTIVEEDEEDEPEEPSVALEAGSTPGRAQRKVSIVVNEGSRRSIMKGAMVLKVQLQPEPEEAGPQSAEQSDSSRGSRTSSDSDSSDDDNEFAVYASSSSSDEEADEIAATGKLRGSTIYQRILKNKTLRFKFLSESLYKFRRYSAESASMSSGFVGADIKPMFDAPLSQAGDAVMGGQYPLLLPGRNDYILSERVVVLGPVPCELNVAVVYEPTRDRLVVEAISREQALKFRIPLYQHDIDLIFPTRPTLKLFDFTSHMMNRYIDAIVRLLRIDRMIRRDAFSLALQVQTAAQLPRTGTGGRPGTGMQSTRNRSVSDDGPMVSFAETKPLIDGVFMCSLLPDGRDTRVQFVESIEPPRSLPVPKTKNRKIIGIQAIDHFPERVDVNGGISDSRATSAPGARRGPIVVMPSEPSISAGQRPLSQGRQIKDSSSLPEIRKKNSVQTIDVNHGKGLFVPLNRSASVESPVFMEMTSGDNAVLAVPGTLMLPTPPPPRHKASSRPPPGARVMIAQKEDSLEQEELTPATMLKLVDATAALADRLGYSRQIPSPRQKIMGGTDNKAEIQKKKSMKSMGSKFGASSTLPTAGDIARIMREVTVAREKGIGNMSAPVIGKKLDYLDTDEYNVDDVVLVMNIRKEGEEALLLLGGINVEHDALWGSFL